MNKLKRILNIITDLNDLKSLAAHEKILSAIMKLGDLIPQKYSHMNLIDIILPKTYGYHTGFDNIFHDYCRLAQSVKKVIRHEQLSKQVSYHILKIINSSRLKKRMENNKNEMEIYFQSAGSGRGERSKDILYNLFFANSQTYLRVLVLYIQQSQKKNNLLVVPKYLRNVEILRTIDKKMIVYFDDFITDNIYEIYNDSINEFTHIFRTNTHSIKEIFAIDDFNFFKMIEVGIENVFKYLIPQAILFYLTVEEIFRHVDVNAVIGVRVRKIYDRAFYTCANHQGINNFTLLHANIGNDFRYIHSMGHFNDLKGVFVWSERQKLLIERDKLSNVENIYVTGSPLFIKSVNSFNRSKKICILYAGAKNDSKEVKTLIKMMSMLNKKYKLMIKIHPGVDESLYERFVDQENIVLIPGNRILENYFKNTRILITTISLAAIQAMLEGIPSIFLSINNRWKESLQTLYYFDKVEEEQFVIKDKKHLISKVNNLLASDKYLERFISEQFKFLDKRIHLHSNLHGAAERIGNILDKGKYGKN
ncbi:hypothetical protein E3V55_04305 [Candidatus Marinimicrobia bacterium MT.SAG.3]|nr:hypothetical protein E3V55_04305 [Candidatus Marinimicrobia bacterium MT.SAG.3]